ncbi:hypothetical protein [Gottfriedia acidiceleris]|uniref:hypothetical protein n=1 Tax=Gottfriedia acidiceleris TaxID=371036 RepID=UPI003D1D8E3F
MVRNLAMITFLLVLVIIIYGYFTTLFINLLPYLIFILGISILVNGLKVKNKPLKKNLFIIAASVFLISFIRIMLN